MSRINDTASFDTARDIATPLQGSVQATAYQPKDPTRTPRGWEVAETSNEGHALEALLWAIYDATLENAVATCDHESTECRWCKPRSAMMDTEGEFWGSTAEGIFWLDITNDHGPTWNAMVIASGGVRHD